MDWPELLRELKIVIRQRTDRLSLAMLSLTCKAEYELRTDNFYSVFDWFCDACEDGFLNVCQWLYERANDYEKSLIFFDDALYHGHYEIGEWAHLRGIRLNNINHLALNNKLDALKWIVAHGYELDEHIISSAAKQLPMIQWLVEEQGKVPENAHLYEALPGIPYTLPIVEYYFNRGLDVDDSSHPRALSAGRWDILDVLQRHRPQQYAQILSRYPIMKELHARRDEVGWKQYIDFDTGNVVDEDSDSD
jgi:hypothetical protein